jgi:nucleoside-diphosphate-sugar epimerase
MQLSDLLSTIKKYSIDNIIHDAAMLTPGAMKRPYAGVMLNINGTLNVLEAARIENVKRLIF